VIYIVLWKPVNTAVVKIYVTGHMVISSVSAPKTTLSPKEGIQVKPLHVLLFEHNG
jgi:hypothetical protein